MSGKLRPISIGQRTIGLDKPPFVIAEMSGNHNQSLERALAIVDAAAESGAHAIKLQTYTADTLTLDIHDGDFFIADSENLWQGKSLYELYDAAHTPWEWHGPIMERARGHGLVCFSSAFDETAVDFLEGLGVEAYKIASFEIVHLPLIRKAASTGKPLILSTGMAGLGEIEDAVRAAREGGCEDLILLKCTSSYPASPVNSNVRTIPHLREMFDCQVGISDHTLGVGAAVAAVTLGATVIEKHFTLSRADGGVDSAFSMEPDEMAALVGESERAWQALGTVRYGAGEDEKKSMVFRRSIYLSADVRHGDTLTRENMRIIRPGFGLAPKYYESLLGKTVAKSASRGTPVTWDLLSG